MDSNILLVLYLAVYYFLITNRRTFFADLQFWYGNGPGNPTTAAMGIGYVEELVSRLTQTRINTFDSAVNASIVTNPVLFPLNQSIYVDASHDTVLSTCGSYLLGCFSSICDSLSSVVYVAMNFTSLASNGPLPTDHIPKDQVGISGINSL